MPYLLRTVAALVLVLTVIVNHQIVAVVIVMYLAVLLVHLHEALYPLVTLVTTLGLVIAGVTDHDHESVSMVEAVTVRGIITFPNMIKGVEAPRLILVRM